jgi:acetyl esterase
MANITDMRVRTGGGSVPVRVLTPRSNPRGVIAYYHGGGWVLGGISAFEPLGRHIAARTSCTVVLVGYRLAPEYRFPTAVEDSWAALQWIAGHLTEIAGERVPLLVAGDSAGGNLSAVVAQRALKAGGPAIGLQVLICPVTDCDLNTTSAAAVEGSDDLVLGSLRAEPRGPHPPGRVAAAGHTVGGLAASGNPHR